MIKQTVAQLNKRHKTNDPFDLTAMMNILVVFEPLGDMLGYFSNYKRIPIIHINESISKPLQKFTCAHELGHRLLHPKINVPFLKANTLQSINRIEREANQFAVELLIPDKLLLEGATIYEAAAICGVPEEVAHLKKPSKKGFWAEERSYINL